MKNKQISNEPFQRFVRQHHTAHKKDLIGKGNNKTSGFPGAKNPSYKRSLSAPPGFGAIGEADMDLSNLPNASIVLIFNPDREVLMLKRSPGKYWGAGQWAAVGGKIDDGEDPEQCILRECFEETRINLEPDRLQYNGVIDGKTHLFSTFLDYTPEPRINFEHTNWSWVNPKKIKEMNCVSNMEEIISEVLQEDIISEEQEEQKVISFDFDNTITGKRNDKEYPEQGVSSIEVGLNDKVYNLIKKYLNQKHEVIITTARQKNNLNIKDIKEFLKHYNIPIKKVIFTNLNDKSPYLLSRNVSIHYDDKDEVLEEIMDNAPSVSIFKVVPLDKRI